MTDDTAPIWLYGDAPLYLHGDTPPCAICDRVRPESRSQHETCSDRCAALLGERKRAQRLAAH